MKFNKVAFIASNSKEAQKALKELSKIPIITQLPTFENLSATALANHWQKENLEDYIKSLLKEF